MVLRWGCQRTGSALGGSRQCVHPGALPTDRGTITASERRNRRGRQQPNPTAPTRRRSDEPCPPSLGGTAAVRVVFGSRVVGVTLVHRPCRRAASGSRPRRLRRPAWGSSTPLRLSRLPPCTRGSSMIATRAHARLSAANGRRMGESPGSAVSSPPTGARRIPQAKRVCQPSASFPSTQRPLGMAVLGTDLMRSPRRGSAQ